MRQCRTSVTSSPLFHWIIFIVKPHHLFQGSRPFPPTNTIHNYVMCWCVHSLCGKTDYSGPWVAVTQQNTKALCIKLQYPVFTKTPVRYISHEFDITYWKQCYLKIAAVISLYSATICNTTELWIFKCLIFESLFMLKRLFICFISNISVPYTFFPYCNKLKHTVLIRNTIHLVIQSLVGTSWHNNLWIFYFFRINWLFWAKKIEKKKRKEKQLQVNGFCQTAHRGLVSFKL